MDFYLKDFIIQLLDYFFILDTIYFMEASESELDREFFNSDSLGSIPTKFLLF